MDNASSFESALNPLELRRDVRPLRLRRAPSFRLQLRLGSAGAEIRRLQRQTPRRLGSLRNSCRSRAASRFASRRRTTSKNSIPRFSSRRPANRISPRRSTRKTSVRTTVSSSIRVLFTNATVAPGTIGNAPRSICCGPGINNWDMSFNKQTRLGERWQMEFRGDVFNVWNHAQFYSVDGDVSNHGQHVWPGATRPRSAAGSVLAQVHVLA